MKIILTIIFVAVFIAVESVFIYHGYRQLKAWVDRPPEEQFNAFRKQVGY